MKIIKISLMQYGGVTIGSNMGTCALKEECMRTLESLVVPIRLNKKARENRVAGWTHIHIPKYHIQYTYTLLHPIAQNWLNNEKA
jgi:hypothetical protein